MYAVIESGGKQYRVELGSEIQVDRLDVQPGDSITLERVLLVADGEVTAVGRPVVDGALVSAQVVRQERGDKVVVFKYKPKARTRVKKGARAELTTLRIADIAYGGRSAVKDAKAAGSEKAKAAKEAEKAAADKAAADQALAAQLAAAAAVPASAAGPAAGAGPADAADAAPAGGKAKTTKPAVRMQKAGQPAQAEAAPTVAEPAGDAPPDVDPLAGDDLSETEAAALEAVDVAPASDPDTPAEAAEAADETRKDD